MNTVQWVIPQMQDGDEDTLRACSILLIPPLPPGELVRRESIPLSLADMADLDWVKMVRDLASRMTTLPHGFCISDQQVASLLTKLERATGIPSCRDCCHPQKVCMYAVTPPTGFSGWSGGPATTIGGTFPPLTRTTSTLSVAQGRAPTTSVGAPLQRAPLRGAGGAVWRLTQTPTSMTSQGSQTVGTPSYAATTMRPHDPPLEPQPMEASAKQAELASYQQELLASMTATPYQQQVFAPTPASTPTLRRGRGTLRQSAPAQLPTPGGLGGQSDLSVLTAGCGRGILSLWVATPVSTSAPLPIGGQNWMESQQEALLKSGDLAPVPVNLGDLAPAPEETGGAPLNTEPTIQRSKSEGWRKDTQRIYAYHLSRTSLQVTSEEAKQIIKLVLEYMEANRGSVVLSKGEWSSTFWMPPEWFLRGGPGVSTPRAGHVCLLDQGWRMVSSGHVG